MAGFVATIGSLAYDLWNWYYSVPKFSDKERQFIHDRCQGCCYMPGCSRQISDSEAVYVNIENNNDKLENFAVICRDCDSKRQGKCLTDFMVNTKRCRGYHGDVFCKNTVTARDMSLCYRCAIQRHF